LIATGDHTRVILAEDGGHFRAVAVRAGRAAGGYTEILDGLTGGEKVVVSGQFLIDSEASLSGALERLNDPAAKPAPATSAPMSGMAMPGDRP
jgi:Cu(I)/Ag(I) efflux system membrane fusion protein